MLVLVVVVFFLGVRVVTLFLTCWTLNFKPVLVVNNIGPVSGPFTQEVRSNGCFISKLQSHNSKGTTQNLSVSVGRGDCLKVVRLWATVFGACQAPLIIPNKLPPGLPAPILPLEPPEEKALGVFSSFLPGSKGRFPRFLNHEKLVTSRGPRGQLGHVSTSV